MEYEKNKTASTTGPPSGSTEAPLYIDVTDDNSEVTTQGSAVVTDPNGVVCEVRTVEITVVTKCDNPEPCCCHGSQWRSL